MGWVTSIVLQFLLPGTLEKHGKKTNTASSRSLIVTATHGPRLVEKKGIAIFPAISHRIHGAGIYANIGDTLMGSMLPYIAAPWIRHGI